MSDSVFDDDVLSDPNKLLPIICNHLPSCSPNLALLIFSVIEKAYSEFEPEQFLIPLLPSLTYVSFTAAYELVIPTVNLIVTLLTHLAQRRLYKFTNKYITEAIALIQQLLQCSNYGKPIHFSLPSFPVTIETLQQPLLLPIIPSTLNNALVLLALHIPSALSLPSSFLHPSVNRTSGSPSSSASVTPHSPTPSLHACIRLWRSLKSHSRLAILSLASRHELISARCGLMSAILAAHILRRAIDPINTVPVPTPMRDRFATVAVDALRDLEDAAQHDDIDGDDKHYAQLQELKLNLLQLSTQATGNSTMSASLWVEQGMDMALKNNEGGHYIRKLVKEGKVDLFSRVHAVDKDNAHSNLLGAGLNHRRGLTNFRFNARPKKRRRTNETEQQRQTNKDNDSNGKSAEPHNEAHDDVEGQDGKQEEDADKDEDEDENDGDLLQHGMARSFTAKFPAFALQTYLQFTVLQEIANQNYFQHLDLLHHAVTITTDALNALCQSNALSTVPEQTVRKSRGHWTQVAVSLTNLASHVCRENLSSESMKLKDWSSLLDLCTSLVKLDVALVHTGFGTQNIDMNSNSSRSNSTQSQRDNITQYNYHGLRQCISTIVLSAFREQKKSNDCEPHSFPSGKLANVLDQIGDAVIEVPGLYHQQNQLQKYLLDVTEYVLGMSEKLLSQDSPVSRLVKSLFHARLCCRVNLSNTSSNQRLTGDGHEDDAAAADEFIPKRLADVVSENIKCVLQLAMAAMCAFADHICGSVGCNELHIPLCSIEWQRLENVLANKSRLVLSKFLAWEPAIKIILDAITSTITENKSAEQNDPDVNSKLNNQMYLESFVKCLTAMTVHCPGDQIERFAKVLVDLMWKVEDEKSLKTILGSLSFLLAVEKNQCKSPKEENKNIQVILLDGENDDSDAVHVNDKSSYESSIISNLLLSKLESQIEKITESTSGSINIPDNINIRPIAYHLLLNFEEGHAEKISTHVCRSLLLIFAIELTSGRTTRFASDGAKNSSNGMAMQYWSDLFATAMHLHERIESNRNLRFGGNSSSNTSASVSMLSNLNENRIVSHSNRKQLSSLGLSMSPMQAIAGLFFSRIADWGHTLMRKMLDQDDFASIVSSVMMESNSSSFWGKFPRHVVTPLLLKKDVDSLESLASRLEISSNEIVERSVADSLAAIELGHTKTNGREEYATIAEILQKAIFDIIIAKNGKIVQRLVMEFGGPHERKAKKALAKFAKVTDEDYQPQRIQNKGMQIEILSGSLVAQHFLLVMDALNRRLFQSRATENEQVRYLRMLKAIILLSKHQIHPFVPKVLATLKRALEWFSQNQQVFAETLLVWTSFLQTLGTIRIVVHLTSILTIIFPFLNRLSRSFCKTLADIIKTSSAQNYNDRSLVILLLRMSNQDLLVASADVIERSGDDCITSHQQKKRLSAGPYALLMMDIPGIERVCRDVGKIIAQYGNGVVEVMATQHLLHVLKINRQTIEEAACSYQKSKDFGFKSSPNRVGNQLAVILKLLVEHLPITRNLECRRLMLRCIGEVGAIDPATVTQSTSAYSCLLRTIDRRKRSSKAQEIPKNIHAMVALLLDDYLVPTLMAQGENPCASTFLINRIGLVVQELIRVCGCKRNTARRASKSAKVRSRDDGPVNWVHVLKGETNEENAIYFWENLLPATRDVIEPYLAEPFDVQQYQATFGAELAGNENAACQPVWSKIKAAASAGAVANAQEWRRQTVVQLVDFIGQQGQFGEVLHSLRPILRYIDTVTAFIFPLVFLTALDVKGDKNNKLKDFLITEIGEVLREATSPEIMFDLFDVLRDWRDERCLKKGHVLANNQYPGNSMTAVSRRKILTPKYSEATRKIDPLSCIVDLFDLTSPSISLLHQAKCAYRARSFHRAILLAENHLRQIRRLKNLTIWPANLDVILGKISTQSDALVPKDSPDNVNRNFTAEEIEVITLLQKCFAELEDKDSLRGIAALRRSSSLSETVIDTEISALFNEALITYERAIAQSPRDVEFHRGFLRCLMTLGHWETMLSHSEGLAHSASLKENELRKTAEANGIEAAWRLGRWDNIRKLDSIPLDNISCDQPSSSNLLLSGQSNSWDNDFAKSLGNMLLALHDRNAKALRKAANDARENLLTPMIRTSLEGYNRAYPMIVRLHVVADVEDSIEQLVTASNDYEDSGIIQQPKNEIESYHPQLPTLVSMKGRWSMTACSLKVREPLLSAKRVCFEQLKLFKESAGASLELAQIAKNENNLESAAATVFRGLTTNFEDEDLRHSLIMEKTEIQYLQGNSSAALRDLKEEINRLTRVVNSYHQRKGSPASDSAELFHKNKERLCNALVVAGSWTANNRSEPAEVVLDYFTQAKKYGQTKEEPFYAIAKHYDSLLQASLNADQDLTVESDGNYGSQNSSRSRRIASANNHSQMESHAPEDGSKYVAMVIKSYAKTLCNGHSRIFEALPRMLTIWFDYYTALDDKKIAKKAIPFEGQVSDAVKQAIEGIPVYMWMTAIPQLISRILHKRKIVQEELSEILKRLICYFPDETYWSIIPTSQFKKSQSLQRKRIMSDIMNQAAKMMSKDKRKNHFHHNLKPRFRDRMYNWLMIMNYFVSICEAPGSKDRRGRMDNCAKEFTELKQHLRTDFENPIIPTLKSLTVRLPKESSNVAVSARGQGQARYHHPFDEETIRIEGIDDIVMVMSSLMCPRRISLLGTDGRQYRYLAKMEDKGDMRRDSRVVEFLTIMNRLLSREETESKSLQLKAYAVLPLTEETGMIEWVNDLCPFRMLVSNEHAKFEKLPSQTAIKQKHDLTSDKRDFIRWAWTTFPSVLDAFFVRYFGGGDAQMWLVSRNEWIRSAAVWSISGYIVGLGDRHGENILIETTTGRCVHVDFAMLFEKGKKLKVPEVVPFRLTQNMIGAMGIAGYEGMFRSVCEQVMSIARQNGDALLSRLESFLYDPLADWGRGEMQGSKAGVVASREAWQARATVKAKLTGMVDNSGLALSIEGQVQRLIREATSIDNLSRMYIWWSAWV